jgi:thiol:disulfide interchange protein DsbD
MKNLILIVALFTVSLVQTQILEPVKWTTSVEKVSDSEVVLIATAEIEDNWHLYSQSVPEDGPFPTTFTFEGNANYLKKGNTIEAAGHVVNDPVFEMEIKYFEINTSFKQRIKLKTQEAFKVNAIVEFMVCDDTRCLAPTEANLIFNVQ